MKIKKGTIALIVIGGCQFFSFMAFQNCARPMSAEESGNASPFQDDKIQLSAAAQAHMSPSGKVDDATDLPAGSQFVLVLSEKCLKDRKAKSPDSYGTYFAHKYLPAEIYTQAPRDFDQAAVKISLRKQIKFEDLKRAVRRDNCIVGLADSQNHQIAMSAINDPEASLQTYLNATDFPASMDFFKQQIGASRVKVAVLDTGYDLQSADKVPLVEHLDGADFTKLAGGARYELSNDIGDQHGHGSQIAHLIAAPHNSAGVAGLSQGSVEILPVKILNSNSGEIPSNVLFDAIKRAVNGKAEVVNLSFMSYSNSCDPVIGQAILYAIERGVFFSIAAGNGLNGEPPAQLTPGEIISPKDNGTLKDLRYGVPACWGRYFKGAVTVGALQTGTKTRASFSNYGLDGVEIAAPGTGIRVLGRGGVVSTVDGTSLAAPQVAAAAALIMAYHKTKGWPYSPWLIEDILLNGSPSDAGLAASSTGFRRGKNLNFQSLANYLGVLATKTPEERRRENSDNSESGAGFSPTSAAPGGGNILSLELYAKRPYARLGERVQLQTVAYFDNGSYKVVTGESSFTSSAGNILSVDANGIGYASASTIGTSTVSASYGGKIASTSIFVGNYDATTGMNTSLESISAAVTKIFPTRSTGYYEYVIKVFGKYADGSVREVSMQSSFSSDQPSMIIREFDGRMPLSFCQSPGGVKHRLTAMYRGARATAEFQTPIEPVSALRVDMTSLTGQQLPNSTAYPNQTIQFWVQAHRDYCINNIQVSSSNSAVNAVVSGWVFDSTGRLTTSVANLPLGRHTLVFKAQYSGGGSPVTLSQNLELEIKDDPIIQMQSSYVDKIPYGAQSSVGYYTIRQSGTQEMVPVSSVDQTFTDESGRDLPFVWADGTFVHVYGVAIGSKVIIKAKHKTLPNLTVQRTLTVTGRMGYVGEYKDMTTASPQAYPSPAADDARCTANARVLSPFAGGQGAEASPYLICSIAQLKAISDFVSPLGDQVFFQLAANLDLSSLGNMARQKIVFKNPSVFLGAQHEISNLSAVDPENNDVSIFASGQPLTVSNLLVRSANIEGRNKVSLFNPVFTSGSTKFELRIKDSFFKNISVRGTMWVGGLFQLESGGGKNARIERVFFSDSSVTGDLYTGGLASSSADIFQSGFQGTVQSSSVAGVGSFMGGIIGANTGGVVIGSYFTGKLKGVKNLGGISANGYLVINNTVNADIIGSGDVVGGIVGDTVLNFHETTSGTSTNYGNSFTGNIWGRSNVGGLIGSGQDIIIENSSVKAGISCESACGGAIGRLWYSAQLKNLKVDVTVNGQQKTGSVVGVAEAYTNLKTTQSPPIGVESVQVILPSGSLLKNVGDLRGAGAANLPGL